MIVAVAAILTGVIGGIITMNDHKMQIESGELDSGARMEEYKNNMHDGEDYGMMKRGNLKCGNHGKQSDFGGRGGRSISK